MTDGTAIIRDATKDEKADYVEIGKELTFDQLFKNELALKEAEYTKAHKPYDRKGAYNDFEDRKAEVAKKYSRQYGEGAEKYMKYTELKLNLDKYGESSRFKLLDESEVYEDKLLDGIRTSVLTGRYLNFQCMMHRGRISVFIPVQRSQVVPISAEKK